MSPAAKLAVEKRVLEGAWSARALGKLLGELEEWDRMAPARRSKAEWLWAACSMASIVGFILMVMFVMSEDRLGLGLALFGAPMVGVLLCWRWVKRLRAEGVPVEVQKTLRPVLEQLRQDLHAEEKIKGKIHLTRFDEDRYKEKKDLPPGKNRKLTLREYEEPVCDLRMPLSDGSTAVLRVEYRIRRVEKDYTSRRGKFKRKKKWKKLTTATAMLVPAAQVKWQPERMAKYVDKKNEKVSFVEKNGVTVARLDRYHLYQCIGNAPEVAMRGADVVGMFVRLAGMRP